MQQLGLFDVEETMKREVEAALKSLRFYKAQGFCNKIASIMLQYDLLDASFDMCRFWMAQHGSDGELSAEDPLLFYTKWREFERHLRTKEYRLHPIIRPMKEHAFLNRLGLRTITRELREDFGQKGLLVLDLLIEIEKWDLALGEARILLGSNAHFRGSRFFLQCSKTVHKNGLKTESMQLLLRAFWDSPDLIQFEDIVDEELVSSLSEIESDYENEADSVELIPYIILMERRISPATKMKTYLRELEQGIRRCENRVNEGEKRVRIRYRLFCLRAWEIELSDIDGSILAKRRREMKSLDARLYRHYIGRLDKVRRDSLNDSP